MIHTTWGVDLPNIDETGKIHIGIVNDGTGPLLPDLNQLIPGLDIHSEMFSDGSIFQRILFGRFTKDTPAVLKIEKHRRVGTRKVETDSIDV